MTPNPKSRLYEPDLGCYFVGHAPDCQLYQVQLMSYENKLKKAREIVELIGAGKPAGFGKAPSREFADIQKRRNQQLFDLQVELRAKYMSDEQLDALLKFYKSEMGISIIKTNEIINSEFRELFLQRMTSNHQGKDGSVWMQPKA
ncbi:MAG: DUF2059 domain-containing protein [Pseudomonadales bacterium]|nr:DUF2059 domain-containing protein [Pseudomonadales bacterium]